MATFLDLGLVDKFSNIFIFLLIFAVVFAILEKIQFFGKDKRGIHGIIALAVAVILIISRPAVLMINFMAPWFVVLFIFIFFILFAVRMFGMSEKGTLELIKDTRVYPYLAIVAIIIIIAGFSSAYGQLLLEKGTGIEDDGIGVDDGDPVVIPGDIEGGSTKTTSFGTNVLNTLVHPKVLGFLALILIGVFTITFLTKPA